MQRELWPDTFVDDSNLACHGKVFDLSTSSVASLSALLHCASILPFGPLGFCGLALIFLLIAVVYDLGSRHRVHIAHILRCLAGRIGTAAADVSGTGTWWAIAQVLVGRLG